ncbi:MAG: hypothetical protein JNM34_07175 [Chthonomonadaceae bacterium]|nr:hypothetical protein [Chthonomonadaceae bacterium]
MLRERGLIKFVHASKMLFDRDGLEMASHEQVSRNVHRPLFPNGVDLVDMTCGLGSDLSALSEGNVAKGYELNSERAELARYNISVMGSDAEVIVGDSLESNWKADFAFADPSRRDARGRSLDPGRFSPALGPLIEKLSRLALGVIKLSPMLPDPFLDQLSHDRVFVSHQGECKEVLVIVGGCRESVPRGVNSVTTEDGMWIQGGLGLLASVPDPHDYIFESDPAVIRSGGLAGYGIPGLGDSNGYLTSDSLSSKIRKAYQTLWFGKGAPEVVYREAKNLGVSVVAIKSRGVELQNEKLKRTFSGLEGPPAVALFYRVGQSVRAALARQARDS